MVLSNVDIDTWLKPGLPYSLNLKFHNVSVSTSTNSTIFLHLPYTHKSPSIFISPNFTTLSSTHTIRLSNHHSNTHTSIPSSTSASTNPSTSSQTPPLPPPPPPFRPRPSNLRPNPKQPERYTPSSFHTSSSDSEPTSFSIANRNPCWQAAMAAEYSALMRNGTWSFVLQVPGTNIVDCKWVYKIKKDQHGAVKRYKACLIAKGFHQQPGIDYNDTFSPVVKSTTIRVVLSLAITRGWSLRQLDVQNAFLHGDLTEIVYVSQPPGFVDPQKPDHVCLLHKSLYGLKQAPRAWFNRLSMALIALGFKGSKTDPSLFIYSAHRTLLYMLVYVDDIILTSNDPRAIDRVVHSLSTTFTIQDMGHLSYFLGIEIIPKVSSPLHTTANLAIGDSPLFDNPVKYRQIVGALQYVTLSRPDLAFAVNKVCQFMHSPTQNHRLTRMLICKRSQTQTGLGVRMTVDPLGNSFSILAIISFLGLLSNKRLYLGRLQNLSATYMSANPVFHARTKHVEVDFHFVREKVAQKKLNVQFISTTDQIADIFSKPLPSQRFLLLRSKLQVAPQP
ncbi:hypothetical protein E3N88_18401 [Mikania micrantha]|uniref:Reverse transcriptase Ty1/copia-type domain-containing protein n=1 Tax=Mikania micrantha TaxID=192012 RepID=A0A5N6NMR5_9ASTR|nr:hypothetical protein E3N88_18401 [Mikania micrantha]